eukprot:SAG11_NODE_4319_length_1950_cov_1.651540_3_plen_191_part_00
MLRDKLLRPTQPRNVSDDGSCYEPLVRIEIVEVHWTPWAAEAKSARELALQLGQHPTSSRNVIHEITHKELIRTWNANKSIQDSRLRRKAAEQLTYISKRRFHISLLCEPTISYPASVFFPKVLIKRAGVRLLRCIQGAEYFDPCAMRRLEVKLRAVRSRAVGQLMINHRKYDNAFDPAHPHACTCHLYP